MVGWASHGPANNDKPLKLGNRTADVMLFEVSLRCMRIITAMENSLLNTPEMATNKRRKLEGESSPAPQGMVPFTFRVYSQ